jgi:general secretion pathway protein G
MHAERRERGVTYLELLATAAIMLVLASAILPMAKVTAKRAKEIELRRSLRELRRAVDDYKNWADHGQINDAPPGSENYPAELEKLVEGSPIVGQIGRKKKFLRRIPRDPMTNSTEWGLRCYQDEPDSDSWCGSNVWDVYTKSKGKGLDGTPYSEW